MINVDNVINILSEGENSVDDTIDSVKCPFIGRVHFVQDKEGQRFSALVFAYWLYGTLCTLCFILMPRYEEGNVSLPVYLGFLLVSSLCLISFFRASLTHPGRIPTYPEYADTGSTWNTCRVCGRMRPPRAHHCRRCGHCVMKMDHHCPWINNCVGEENQYLFLQLLLYAFLLGLYAFTLSMFHFWVFPKCESCIQNSIFGKHSVWFLYLLCLMSINMTCMMFMQLGTQHGNLLLNKTTLERMSAPLDNNLQLRQCYTSYREVCGYGHYIFWLCPIGRRRPLLHRISQHPV